MNKKRSASTNLQDDDDDERRIIRNELSTLSFEDLQKLKEKVGIKVYKEAVFGKNNKVHNESKVFKRENKNRPREMSSKKPVRMILDTSAVKKTEIRDPRFDPLCGEFDKKEFAQNYNFLSDIRIKDIKAIRAELKQTTDPEREQKLRRLLQRLNDQHKADKKHKVESEEKEKEKHQVERQSSEGRQTFFKNKAEQKVESLVKQYEDLKKEGTSRVQRHLKRRQQKIKKRSHKAPTGVS